MNQAGDPRSASRQIPPAYRRPSIAASIASRDSRRTDSADTIEPGGLNRTNSGLSALQSIENKPQEFDELFDCLVVENRLLLRENEVLKSSERATLQQIQEEVQKQGEVQNNILQEIRQMKAQNVQGEENVLWETQKMRGNIQNIRAQDTEVEKNILEELEKAREDIRNIKRGPKDEETEKNVLARLKMTHTDIKNINRDQKNAETENNVLEEIKKMLEDVETRNGETERNISRELRKIHQDVRCTREKADDQGRPCCCIC